MNQVLLILKKSKGFKHSILYNHIRLSSTNRYQLLNILGHPIRSFKTKPTIFLNHFSLSQNALCMID